jgi:hypothetical protein
MVIAPQHTMEKDTDRDLEPRGSPVIRGEEYIGRKPRHGHD